MAEYRNADLLVYLQRHDAPCTACGYNLRGVTTHTCPECGGTIVLGELRERAESELSKTPLMSQARGLMAGALACAVVGAVAVVMGVGALAQKGVRVGPPSAVIVLGGVLMLTGGLTMVWRYRTDGNPRERREVLTRVNMLMAVLGCVVAVLLLR